MKKLILLLATAIFTFTACEIIDELGNENNNSNTEIYNSLCSSFFPPFITSFSLYLKVFYYLSMVVCPVMFQRTLEKKLKKLCK